MSRNESSTEISATQVDTPGRVYRHMTQIAFLGRRIDLRLRGILTIGLSPLWTSIVVIGCGSGGIVTSKPVTTTPPSGSKAPIVVQAAQSSVAINASDAFSATQQGNAVTGGQWVVLGGIANGTIDATGMYHAPAAVPNPATVFVGYVLADQIFTQTITITDSSPSGSKAPIVVQAAQSSVAINASDAFSATQQGSAVTGGQWVVLGGIANGTIDATGMYHAPAAVPNPATVFVGYVLAGEIYSTTVSITNSKTTVSSITPSVIQTLTAIIQITGNGFDTTSFATVNGTATPTTFIDSQHVSAVIKLPHPISASFQIAVANPDANASASNSVTLTASFPTITVQPATLVGGDVNLSISGSKFSAGDVVFLNGKPLTTVVRSSTQISASGYLPPWSNGNAVVEVASGDGTSPIAAQAVPIAPTAVSYDAAARFTTQAAFGPRPDLVAHIQNIGFDAYITEQLKQPPVAYISNNSSNQHLIDFIAAATTGNSLLRQRVALGLQSIFVTQQQDFSPSFSNLEKKLELDVSGNFRQLLDDIASDPSLTTFLNLPGNRASTNQFDQPNQNFARELLQLFTLGPLMLNDDGSLRVDGDGNTIPTYTQDTVINLTRALTGWHYPTPISTIDTAWGIDFSQPLAPIENWHDHNAKTLFSAINLPAGQSVALDRQAALDAIFNHPNLPPFICRLLIQRLVKSNPSPAYIQRIATVFEDNGTQVRGNLGAVIRAILLDPEARLGDVTPSSNDGFLQQPLLLQLFAMNALQDAYGDDQKVYLAGNLGEAMGASPTVFYYFSPSYNIPGTSINSPEFMLFNNISLIQRSQALWGIVTGTLPGYKSDYQASSWLFTRFTTVPDMVDALNHLLYHGQMSQEQQAAIVSYCSQLNPFDVKTQLESAIFLALNGDSNNVSH